MNANTHDVNAGPTMNGVRVTRLGETTILIPLPRELWRSAGPCRCSNCKGREGFWDTLAVSADPPSTGRADTAWTVHAPEAHRIEGSHSQARPERSGSQLTAEWLWSKLMDWCRIRGVSPSRYDDLFAIVGEARQMSAVREEVVPGQTNTPESAHEPGPEL
jgi:hypothetical protein